MTMTMKYLSKSRVVVADGRRGRVVKPAPRQSVVDPVHRHPEGHCECIFRHIFIFYEVYLFKIAFPHSSFLYARHVLFWK